MAVATEILKHNEGMSGELMMFGGFVGKVRSGRWSELEVYDMIILDISMKTM